MSVDLLHGSHIDRKLPFHTGAADAFIMVKATGTRAASGLFFI